MCAYKSGANLSPEYVVRPTLDCSAILPDFILKPLDPPTILYCPPFSTGPLFYSLSHKLCSC